jgi:hypothetical protein
MNTCNNMRHTNNTMNNNDNKNSKQHDEQKKTYLKNKKHDGQCDNKYTYNLVSIVKEVTLL